jgi:hypothetical protein
MVSSSLTDIWLRLTTHRIVPRLDVWCHRPGAATIPKHVSTIEILVDDMLTGERCQGQRARIVTILPVIAVYLYLMYV